MNISKQEQRVLHALAQGGAIHYVRATNGKVQSVTCFTREGFALQGCTLDLFVRLKRRNLIRSRRGKPYRISQHGLASVRAQLDNR